MLAYLTTVTADPLVQWGSSSSSHHGSTLVGPATNITTYAQTRTESWEYRASRGGMGSTSGATSIYSEMRTPGLIESRTYFTSYSKTNEDGGSDYIRMTSTLNHSDITRAGTTTLQNTGNVTTVSIVGPDTATPFTNSTETVTSTCWSTVTTSTNTTMTKTVASGVGTGLLTYATTDMTTRSLAASLSKFTRVPPGQIIPFSVIQSADVATVYEVTNPKLEYGVHFTGDPAAFTTEVPSSDTIYGSVNVSDSVLTPLRIGANCVTFTRTTLYAGDLGLSYLDYEWPGYAQGPSFTNSFITASLIETKTVTVTSQTTTAVIVGTSTTRTGVSSVTEGNHTAQSTKTFTVSWASFSSWKTTTESYTTCTSTKVMSYHSTGINSVSGIGNNLSPISSSSHLYFSTTTHITFLVGTSVQSYDTTIRKNTTYSWVQYTGAAGVSTISTVGGTTASVNMTAADSWTIRGGGRVYGTRRFPGVTASGGVGVATFKAGLSTAASPLPSYIGQHARIGYAPFLHSSVTEPVYTNLDAGIPFAFDLRSDSTFNFPQNPDPRTGTHAIITGNTTFTVSHVSSDSYRVEATRAVNFTTTSGGSTILSSSSTTVAGHVSGIGGSWTPLEMTENAWSLGVGGQAFGTQTQTLLSNRAAINRLVTFSRVGDSIVTGTSYSTWPLDSTKTNATQTVGADNRIGVQSVTQASTRAPYVFNPNDTLQDLPRNVVKLTHLWTITFEFFPSSSVTTNTVPDF